MYDDRRLSPKTQLGLAALGAAALLGLIADLLLRPAPNGINVTICVALFVSAILLLSRRWLLGFTGGGRWLLLAVLAFAVAFAWRDSPVLRALNSLALLAALAPAIVRLRSGQVRVAGLVEYAVVGLQTSVGTALGPLFLMLDAVQWRELPRDGRWYGPARAIGRGLLIVAPLLFIFGGLFVAADAVFAGIGGEVFAVDAIELFGHLALICILGWIVAGLLRVALFSHDWNLRVGPPPGGLALGAIEVGIILGLLNLLFLAFVAVQVRYLFGGEALVLVSSTLTYADYARRGFFELATVSALVLPVLLLAHWGPRADDRAVARLFRPLASALVVLLFAIMASAVQRMRLYQETYGLTELRLYTTAFMGWLALVFLWFVATVLRERRELFAFGALVGGFAVIALLNALNPDALIIRANAALADAPANNRAFDASYGTSLSADAIPELITILPSLDPSRQHLIATGLLRGLLAQHPLDWRNWNHARWSARNAIEANRPALETYARLR
jgi:hypothetical protein